MGEKKNINLVDQSVHQSIVAVIIFILEQKQLVCLVLLTSSTQDVLDQIRSAVREEKNKLSRMEGF